MLLLYLGNGESDRIIHPGDEKMTVLFDDFEV